MARVYRGRKFSLPRPGRCDAIIPSVQIMNMERQAERTLEILTAIGGGEALTQRALAERLGVAVGLTNLYLKRLAGKGYIKVTGFGAKPLARKRLRYLLTAKGLTEKTRLTYRYMHRSLSLYRLARETLREALRDLPVRGGTRIALYGTGEPAELAYLTVRELGLEPVGVYAAEAREGGAPPRMFLGLPVQDLTALATADVDAVIVATFDKPKL